MVLCNWFLRLRRLRCWKSPEEFFCINTKNGNNGIVLRAVKQAGHYALLNWSTKPKYFCWVFCLTGWKQVIRVNFLTCHAEFSLHRPISKQGIRILLARNAWTAERFYHETRFYVTVHFSQRFILHTILEREFESPILERSDDKKQI